MKKNQKQEQNKRRDLRIIWSSNAPFVYSGYGVFTKELLKRLHDDGWPVACIAFSGLSGGIIDNYDGYKIYPQMSETYGTDALINHGKDFKADVHFTMQDTPTLNAGLLPHLKTWIPYMPVHYSPPSPFVLDKIKHAYKIITFSKYGQDGLATKGFSSSMIKEGINTSVFKPLDKAEIRAKLGIKPETFLFGMVGANKEMPPRKGFQEAIDAFAMFVRDNPDSKAGLYIHTLSPPIGKFPIMDYAKQLGIQDRVLVPDNYAALYKTPPEVINQIMNMFDVLLQPSRTEGFGLPVVEAQACGVPALVTDFSALPELIVEGKTGLKVKVDKLELASQWGYHAVPDTQDLYKQMNKIYKMLKKDTKGKIAKACRKHVLANFDIDQIFQNEWLPFMESLQEELLGPVVDKK